MSVIQRACDDVYSSRASSAFASASTVERNVRSSPSKLDAFAIASFAWCASPPSSSSSRSPSSAAFAGATTIAPTALDRERREGRERAVQLAVDQRLGLAPERRHAGGSKLHGTLTALAPFAIEGRWGAIVVAPANAAELGDRELELLGGLAHQAKLAIANASSFEGLERTFLSTVEALANALEARDEYTSSHARWITDTAILVGQELGLDGETLKQLDFGALFHDIGKIGIPNSVLLKPGPLTHEERELIETHPELGAKIIAPIDQLQDVCGIVRACHERWDGAGYPDRKAGEEIPLEARIIFACDAFHAMTTDRPLSERARSAGRRCGGSRRRRARSSTRASSTSACACSSTHPRPTSGSRRGEASSPTRARARWPSRRPPRLRVDWSCHVELVRLLGGQISRVDRLASLVTSRSTLGLPVRLTGYWSSLQLVDGRVAIPVAQATGRACHRDWYVLAGNARAGSTRAARSGGRARPAAK